MFQFLKRQYDKIAAFFSPRLKKDLPKGKKNKKQHRIAYILDSTNRELFYYARHSDHLYQRIQIRKKNGGSRILYTPTKRLKQIQSRILEELLEYMEISPYATAYQKGKSLSDNAAPHVNHRYLLKMDIRNYFDTISFQAVLSAAFPSSLYPKQWGYVLTSICCKDETLPQGAPTSPAISNLVLKNFDDAIGPWCEKNGVVYSRYCDDLTFSCDSQNVLYVLSQKVESMLRLWGFFIHPDKTKIISNTSRQTVTGLCVNEKVSVPASYKKSLRQEVYYAVKFGLQDSLMRSRNTRFYREGKWDAKGYYLHLAGKLRYVLQIEPNNRAFSEFSRRLDKRFAWEMGEK